MRLRRTTAAPVPALSRATDWRTFTSLAAQTTINAFVYSTYLARLPDIRAHAGISTATLGAVMTGGNLAGLAGSLLAPPLLARWGSRRLLQWGGPAYVMTLPVIGASTSLVLLVTAIVTMMVANAVVDMALAMQQTAFSAQRGRPVMSRLSGLYSLGTVGGGLLAAAILATGVDVTVHLLALAAALVAALSVVGRGLLATDPRPGVDARAVPSAGRAAATLAPARRRRRLVGPVLLLAVASAVIVPLDVVPGEWATFRMTDDLGQTRAGAALAYFTFTAGMTLGRLGGDHAATALGRAQLALWATALSAAGLAIGAGLPQPALATAGFFLAGAGTSVLAPLLTEAAGRAPGPPGAGLRALFVGNRLAGLATPVLVGSMAGLPHVSVGATMLLVALPCAATFALLARSTLTRHPAAPAPAPAPAPTAPATT